MWRTTSSAAGWRGRSWTKRDNTTLIAPLTIEDDAYIGAGSTITSRVGKGDLAVGRGRQKNLQGWVRPDKRKARNKK